MTRDDSDILYLARTNHRNAGALFGIKRRDRRSHIYAIGKTGTGKSHLIRTMVAQDLARGEGLALFDPHGDLAESVATLVPEHRKPDLVYLDLPDPALPWHFNPFAGIAAEGRSLAAAGLVEVFAKLWPDEWGPRLEHLLRNVVFTLLENPDSSLGDVPPLLVDRDYRRSVASRLTNEAVRSFWFEEFERYSPAFRAVVVAPLQNKVGALLTDPLLKRVLTEDGPRLDLRSAMDGGSIVIANLDKGRIGEGPATILGSFLLSHISLAGISRSDRPEDERRDFFVYLDEFQTFTTLSLANMLSELRKYRVGLVLAHQHLAQLSPPLREAVFGNVGTLCSFRVGGGDAAYLAREFSPIFAADDLTSLERFQVYLRLLIDNSASRPFSATTLASLDGIPGLPS